MHIWPARASIAVLASGPLVGCGGDDDTVTVSPECLRAIQAASDAITEPDEIYDPLARATAWECETVDEWAQALHDRPAALGLTEAAVDDDAVVSFEDHQNISLSTMCRGPAVDAPLCVDAAAAARLVPCRNDDTQLCLPPDE